MTRSAEKTRERILEAARGLFVASGTAAVSTNHVAAAARISPGNLYYHFSNKEGIIAALLDRLIVRIEQAWNEPPWCSEQVELAHFEAALERSLCELADFSFLARELFSLALYMPSVRERELRLREARVAALEAALTTLIEQRKLCAASGLPRQVAELAWLLGFPALAEAELAGETGARAARRATVATMALILPYAS